MKKIIPIIFLLILQFTFTETIKFSTGDWAPYTSNDMKNNGVICQIVKEAYKFENIDVEFEFLPWKRALYSATKNSKKYAGTFPWYSNDERKENFYLSDSLFECKTVFFYLKSENFDWENFYDLKKLRVGGTLGYLYSTDFDNAAKSKVFYLERVPRDEQNFKKLKAKRIDIFPNDILVGYHQIKNLFNKKEIALFTHHPKPIAIENMHILFSKEVRRNKELLEKFNSGLKKLKKTNRYDKILQNAIKN